MRLRAVVDTNVLVSALLKPGSLPAAVAQLIRSGVLTPVVCDAVVSEYRAVLGRQRLKLDPDDVGELLHVLATKAEWVRITPYERVLKLPDPDDWPFIACGLAVQCPVITGNARHFPVGTGVLAMTPRQWLDWVRGVAG